MKKVILFIGWMVLSGLSFGQEYTIVQTTGTSYPYINLQSDSTAMNEVYILDDTDVDGLSSWQILPFGFQFYGETVDGYYVSDKGYITFDNTVPSNYSNNTDLPNTDGPNNAIYAFWDDLNINSWGLIWSATYGTAPNRIHTINWLGMEDSALSGSAFFSLFLFESGEFAIIHEGGELPESSGTIGCEDAAGLNATQFEGSPNISFASDTKVYLFTSGPNQYNLSILNINLPSKLLVGSHPVNGVIVNLGTEDITSFDLNYSVNGGAEQSMSISGVSLLSGASYGFTLDSPLDITNSGEFYDLCIYTDNLNVGNADQNTDNDEKCQKVFGYSGTSGDRNVLLEEFNGTWCQYCPDGDVEIENILAAYPDEIFAASFHLLDAMEIPEGLEADGIFSGPGYPNALVNRRLFPGQTVERILREDWATRSASLLGTYTPANVSIAHTYDPVSRVIQMTIIADFVDDAIGDLRFIPMIIEDSVTGTGSGYDQKNFYNTVVGHPYYGAGDPVVGYVHNHVIRAIPVGVFGNEGVIPSPVYAGTQVSEQFSYTLPANMNEENISIIGFVAYYSSVPLFGTYKQREIIDVAKNKLADGITPVINLPEFIADINLFPNPSSDQINLSLNLLEKTNATVIIFDNLGRQVMNFGTKDFEQGIHQLNLDISALSEGLYQLSIITSEYRNYSRKFTVVE